MSIPPFASELIGIFLLVGQKILNILYGKDYGFGHSKNNERMGQIIRTRVRTLTHYTRSILLHTNILLLFCYDQNNIYNENTWH